MLSVDAARRDTVSELRSRGGRLLPHAMITAAVAMVALGISGGQEAGAAPDPARARGAAATAARARPKPQAIAMDRVMQMVDRSFASQGKRHAHPVALRRKGGGRERSAAPYFQVPGQAGRALETLPLKSTHARVSIAGVMARVRVQQVYRNEGSQPIEAVYVFPGSTRAAVHGMRMRIGDRVVEAQIARREAARRRYRRARRQGRRASLLEQQRANVFTMRVANIMPGDTIKVELDYSELLVPEQGTYEFVYPTVVGPRFPGGTDSKKDRWIANPYVKPGGKIPYRFGLDLHLESPIGLKEVGSPSHAVKVRYPSGHAADVKLTGTQGGNRDFVLRYRLAGGQIETGAMTYQAGGEQFFLMMMEPPRRVRAREIPRREYIFVVDVSGSMHGFPLETSKALIRQLMGHLRPSDYFNVVLFAGGSHVLNRTSVPATELTIGRALQVIDRQRGGGGTHLMQALRTAYAIPKVDEAGVSRSVVVLTDGYVGVEAQTFRFIRKRLNQANCYAFGIGSSVNRALIEGIARAGLGAPFVALNRRSAAKQAERFRKYVQSPVLTGIELSYQGGRIYDVIPRRPPDLLAQRPLVVFGKYQGAGSAIRVTGRTGQGAFERILRLGAPSRSAATQPLRALWARKWVESLTDQLAMLPRSRELQEAVASLGLGYNLLTRFTSFVAVDRVIANRTGQGTTVKQPLPLPKGVSGRAVGGKHRYRRGRARRRHTPHKAPPPTSPGASAVASDEAERRVYAQPAAQRSRIGGCQCEAGRGAADGPAGLLLLPLAVWGVRRRRRAQRREK